MSDDFFNMESIPKKPKKIKVSSAEIIVHGVKEKPYFEIKYFDLFDNELHIGFGSYKLDIVFEYLRDFFEIVSIQNKVMDQNNKKFENDLISRKSAYKAFSDYLNKCSVGEISSYTELNIGEIASVIKSIPTAFDKEKVIGEIQNQHELSDTCAYESDYPTEVSYYKGRALGHEIDIEIVEKGGIE